MAFGETHRPGWAGAAELTCNGSDCWLVTPASTGWGPVAQVTNGIMCLDASSWNLQRPNLNALSTGWHNETFIYNVDLHCRLKTQWRYLKTESFINLGHVRVLIAVMERAKQLQFFFIIGSSLNYLTCLALYLCLAVTHRQLNNSWRATTEGERRCGPHDSHAFRKHCCEQSKIPETNGPCLWSMLHVCHIVWPQNDFRSVASDMTLLLLKHISQCLFVRVCLCGVCLRKALISFQPSCSHHHLLLPLLVSLPPFSPYQMKKIIITTSDLKWTPAEVLMFCLWLQRWHWRCDLPTLRGSVNEWWMLYYK